jgi:hypothetical protein
MKTSFDCSTSSEGAVDSSRGRQPGVMAPVVSPQGRQTLDLPELLKNFLPPLGLGFLYMSPRVTPGY